MKLWLNSDPLDQSPIIGYIGCFPQIANHSRNDNAKEHHLVFESMTLASELAEEDAEEKETTFYPLSVTKRVVLCNLENN